MLRFLLRLFNLSDIVSKPEIAKSAADRDSGKKRGKSGEHTHHIGRPWRRVEICSRGGMVTSLGAAGASLLELREVL